MEPVAAFLLTDKHDDQQADGHAEGEPCDLDNRKALIPQQHSNRNFEVVADH
jgi:hypothetical protein